MEGRWSDPASDWLGFQVSDVKPKPKQLQWPITTDENNTMNQWELKANTRNRRQARENACDQVAIGFGFASDWLTRWREIFKPITERSKAIQNKHSIENRSNIHVFSLAQYFG